MYFLFYRLKYHKFVQPVLLQQGGLLFCFVFLNNNNKKTTLGHSCFSHLDYFQLIQPFAEVR